MTEKEIESARARKVRKSNELIQKARYKLSLPGQKILLYLISRIPPDADKFEPMEFSIPEFCEVCDIVPAGNNYKMLEDALSDLLTDSARIWIALENGLRTPIMWIEKPYIDENNGKIMVTLDKDMRPYLLNLKANYSTFELVYTLHFRSKYSIRLYEIVRSFQYHPEKPFSKIYPVNELRELLDSEQYQQYRDFKKRVLLTAIREVNEYSDKTVVLKEHKTGRAGKVQSVELIISAKSGTELDKVREMIGAKPRRQTATPATRKRATAPRKRARYGDSNPNAAMLDVQRIKAHMGMGTDGTKPQAIQ